MELAYIVVRFDSPEEQKYVEEHCGFAIENNETWGEDSHYTSWTEFDIQGCKPKDLEVFNKLCTK